MLKFHHVRVLRGHNYGSSVYLLAFDFLYRHREEEVTSTELAAHCGVTSSSVTRIIDKMVECNHLHREIKPKDRRKIYISLSQEGVELWGGLSK